MVMWFSAVVVMFMVFNTTLKQYYSYMVAVSFIGRGNSCIEYTSPWTGFELTTLVLIGTDCIGSRKSNYHTNMTTWSLMYITFADFNLLLWKHWTKLIWLYTKLWRFSFINVLQTSPSPQPRWPDYLITFPEVPYFVRRTEFLYRVSCIIIIKIRQYHTCFRIYIQV